MTNLTLSAEDLNHHDWLNFLGKMPGARAVPEALALVAGFMAKKYLGSVQFLLLAASYSDERWNSLVKSATPEE